MTALRVAAIAAIGALTVAGCSSSGGGTDSPAVSPSSSAPGTTSSTPPPSSAAPSSAAPSSVAPSSSAPSSAPASPSPAASSAPSGPPACKDSQVTVNLVRGGAIQHVQLAGLIFTNTAATACTLLGYPFAQLMRGGRTLGRPAQHQGPVGPGVVLTRNVGAEAQLEATTDCQAPLSDHVRVRAPGLSQSADLADTLRACTLTVSAVHRS